ncbi:hypothetical protein RFI_06301 [Reticulomyxa filosa]|uniref:Uncharacterized protein n=1 Tax=Reticulomyxa filosa TaxID=46433 RepID=X6NZT9_RETFI|nr:hypothetical protein RFI_06301 [Reticulomyxa filosa]|eukprot:ETO30817.1 hypothetical protein RFI_06301 [Reticulomyxa filosa]
MLLDPTSLPFDGISKFGTKVPPFFILFFEMEPADRKRKASLPAEQVHEQVKKLKPQTGNKDFTVVFIHVPFFATIQSVTHLFFTFFVCLKKIDQLKGCYTKVDVGTNAEPPKKHKKHRKSELYETLGVESDSDCLIGSMSNEEDDQASWLGYPPDSSADFPLPIDNQQNNTNEDPNFDTLLYNLARLDVAGDSTDERCPLCNAKIPLQNFFILFNACTKNKKVLIASFFLVTDGWGKKKQ